MHVIIKWVLSHPKLIGGILVGVLLAGSLWYLDHRKNQYENAITNLERQVENGQQTLRDQQSEIETYRIKLSTTITEQALKLSEARREAQRVQAEADNRIAQILAQRPESESEGTCERSEELINNMLGL